MEGKAKKNKLLSLWGKQEVGIFVIFIVLCVFIGCITHRFVKPQNIINILRQISNVGIMAVGQAMVIIIAGIDLSTPDALEHTIAYISGIIDEITALTEEIDGITLD